VTAAKPLRILIADDERLARQRLEDLLSNEANVEIVGRTENGPATIVAIRELEPDIVFLDIQMPGMTGLEVARQAAGRCHIVFVTAFDQYAIAAFEQGAVDYVMKPINLPRLATTVTRLKDRITQPPADLSSVIGQIQRQSTDGKVYLRWVNASVGNTIKLITVEEICYFKADSKYTLVVTPASESLIRKPIRELTDEVDPNLFWQIHRSTLVNVGAIAGVTRDVRGNLQVKLKQRPELLAVSESYNHLFRQM
jgi:DNA-binding LytR/AlgR family response regulator